MSSVAGWAVVPDDKDFSALCFTSAPEMIGGGTIFQIYRTEAEAVQFCEEITFSDATYRVVKVAITPLSR